MYTYVYMYMYMYVCMYVYVYIYICICIYISQVSTITPLPKDLSADLCEIILDWTRCYGKPCIVFLLPTGIFCWGASHFVTCCPCVVKDHGFICPLYVGPFLANLFSMNSTVSKIKRQFFTLLCQYIYMYIYIYVYRHKILIYVTT